MVCKVLSVTITFKAPRLDAETLHTHCHSDLFTARWPAAPTAKVFRLATQLRRPRPPAELYSTVRVDQSGSALVADVGLLKTMRHPPSTIQLQLDPQIDGKVDPTARSKCVGNRAFYLFRDHKRARNKAQELPATSPRGRE